MDKPLIDNNNTVEDRQQNETSPSSPADGKAVSASSAAPAVDLGQESIGAYSPAATRPLITQKAYDEIKGVAWMDDPKSRLAIRAFSRGVLGAAFFSAGGFLAKKWMQEYKLNGAMVNETYNPATSLLEQNNPLKFIAKLIDTVVGKPIEATVTALAGKEMGLRAVHFRPTRYNRYPGVAVRGRSLGDEVVSITFDFFCASVGDAWGRDIAGWFDPNVKKTWMDEKGHINFPEALKSTLKSVTRYVTYNGGEDWAVAIPYAYFMKGQRALIDRASPGFKYDFDRGSNGGSFKLNDHKIVGNYNLEGMADLHSRFTVYNIGTLMFREAYDYIGNKIAGKPDSLYGAPDKEKPKGLLGKVGDLLKWTARSAIKGTIIMTPAMPFFFLTRTPQSKYHGAFIDPEKGVLAKADGHRIITAENLYKESLPLGYMQYKNEPRPESHKYYDHYDFKAHGTINDFEPSLTQAHPPYQNRNNFDAYGKTYGLVDKGLNAIGRANYKAAGMLDKPAAWADNNFGKVGSAFKSAIGIKQFETFSRRMVYASASYTPYMYAKAEFANLWDNGKTDMAAERLIDGATHFNWGEFKAGAGEIWNSILHKPFEDPAREAEAQRRDSIDTSPADIFNKSHAQMEADKKQVQAEKNKPALKWQDRIVSAPLAEKKPAPVAAKNDKLKPQKNYADQEAMRKALEELTPPTNSIN